MGNLAKDGSDELALTAAEMGRRHVRTRACSVPLFSYTTYGDY